MQITLEVDHKALSRFEAAISQFDPSEIHVIDQNEDDETYLRSEQYVLDRQKVHAAEAAYDASRDQACRLNDYQKRLAQNGDSPKTHEAFERRSAPAPAHTPHHSDPGSA